MSNNGLIIFKKCDRRISKIPVTLQEDSPNFETLPTIIQSLRRALEQYHLYLFHHRRNHSQTMAISSMIRSIVSSHAFHYFFWKLCLPLYRLRIWAQILLSIWLKSSRCSAFKLRTPPCVANLAAYPRLLGSDKSDSDLGMRWNWGDHH